MGVVWVLFFIILPFLLAIAVMRYWLWDIDIIINRALVYGALTVMVAGGYVLLIGAFGALFQARGDLATSVIAIGIILALLGPLRDRVQRAVNHLFGPRDSPRPSRDMPIDGDADAPSRFSSPATHSIHAPMTTRTNAWLAWSLWVFTLGVTAFSLLFLFLNRSTRSYPESFCCSGLPGIELSSLALACAIVGALIASRRGGNVVGWIFCASGLGIVVDLFAIQYAIYTGVI